MSKAEYENGVTMFTSSGGYTNGIKYIGTEGWIFVSRGNYTASASDPVSAEKSSKALDASDKKILNPIRDDGPEDHIIKKIGTPTMGGVIILFGLLLSVLFWGNLSNINIMLILI